MARILKFPKTLCWLCSLALLFAVSGSHNAQASSTASATANVTTTIVPSITLTKTRDLAFGGGTQGDGTKTILASDATNSASFSVTGGNNIAYTITLPADGTVTMTTAGGGSADKIIAVDSFTSSPSATGTLDGSGNDTLTVGATRAAISATQTAGAYTGTFTVTVAY